MRGPLALALISIAALLTLNLRPPALHPPRSGLTVPDRDRALAIQRGLAFIHTTAVVPENFASYGQDFLWCFCTIARTSADPELSQTAWRFGHELALRWRAAHSQLGQAVGPDELYELTGGSQSADCLGIPDESLKREIRQAANRLTAEEVFGFDPAKEPPPDDIPKTCRKCGNQDSRGTRICRRCGTTLVMQDRYGVWCDAVIVAFTGERYGVRLGGGFADVVQWLPRMLPYPAPNDTDEAVYRHAAYAITHVVYAFSDYNYYRLRREWLPREFDFLKSNLTHSIQTEDPELLGEYLDTLKSFGLTRKDPLLAAGIAFLLARQKPDGSWGDPAESDIYNRYHSTWTAIDGLRDYAWRGERVSLPDALRRAQLGPMVSVH